MHDRGPQGALALPLHQQGRCPSVAMNWGKVVTPAQEAGAQIRREIWHSGAMYALAAHDLRRRVVAWSVGCCWSAHGRAAWPAQEPPEPWDPKLARIRNLGMCP